MADFTMYDREREFKWQIECQLSGGTNAYIDAEDIYSGRLTRQISSGEGIEVGSCYVSELDLTIVASALPSNVVSVKPYFRLLTSTEIVDDVVRKYYTPYNLGVFKIASTKRKEYGRIDLVCYDKMADLDALITPAAYTELLASDWKPFYLLDWIATKVGVTYTFTQSGIEAMPNGTLYFKLAEETSNIKTYRDLLQYVCMLIGAYGIFDEDGHLNIKTFADTTSYSLPASFRFSESFGDVPITYSGVELTVKNTTTMFGNANNTVVTLSDNPFLYTLSNLNQTTDYATFIMQFLRNIYMEFQGLSYYAGEFEIPPDASLNVGRLLAVSGGGASDTINCFLQKIDVNFDGRMTLSCGNPNTYVTRTQNRTTSSITNLTNRIETLESAQGSGNKIYTSKSAPDTTLGKDGDLWVKYFVDYNDKLINSLGDEVDINLPRYESADDAYNYVDLTIRPDIRSMRNLTSMEMNTFIKAFEGRLSIAAYQSGSGSVSRNITASQFPQLTVDTYTTNNQSFSVSNGGAHGWSDNYIYYRYIGVSQAIYCPVANMDDFNESFSDGTEIGVVYYYLYYNTSNKKFEYIYGQMRLENVNHAYWDDALWKKTSAISIDLLDTAYYTIDELYCKINDDWTLYESDDGSAVIVNQVLTSGTEIAQINVDGEIVSIYAPSGGSDVTVTPKTTTGTNIADIEVDGITYQLFAPSGGGSGSGYTETSLWSGYKSDTGTINLNDSVENYDVVLIKVTSHPNQPSNKYYESYFTILPSEVNYSQNAPQYSILVVRGYASSGNASMDCHFPSSTSFTIRSINIDDQSAKQVKPAILEVIGLKFGGGGGHNYSTTEQVVGTWIDGSTLYEKTQYGGITFSSQGTWYDTDITNIDKIVSVQGSINRDGEPINIGYWGSSIISTWILRDHTLKMSMQAMASGETYTLNSITVQYTKTS